MIAKTFTYFYKVGFVSEWQVKCAVTRCQTENTWFAVITFKSFTIALVRIKDICLILILLAEKETGKVNELEKKHNKSSIMHKIQNKSNTHTLENEIMQW